METHKPYLFQPGNPGKPKGAISHLNRTVKEVVLETFNKLQGNPTANLLAWAESEPTEFYKIAAKLIPTDIKASVNVTSINLNIERKTGNNHLIDPPSQPAIDAGQPEAL